MSARTRIKLDAELGNLARRKAADLGVSLAEYVRRLVVRDLQGPESKVDVSTVFDLGRSEGADIARRKDERIGLAVAERRPRNRDKS